jgi:hypothetical protein
VILSANKLLKRIMAADDAKPLDNALTCRDLHEHTYGIGTDALTQFAVVFSALIHDVGHEGVPNGILGKEKPTLAERYSHKSIAEQQSVDVAWDLLLLPQFKFLRSCIYQSKTEYARFRYLVVNSVMATDIFDKELKVLRDSRWDTAFHGEKESVILKESIDRKATIVIEHLIQASDVSHTMQHFFIYSKWNERLFKEMYFSYLSGRTEKDPSTGWYNGELWFFDNYVIPLARKLKECAVFGVSSDEYLTYALQNRREWERKGTQICSTMKAKAEREARELGLLKKMEEGSESHPDYNTSDFSHSNTTFDANFDDLSQTQQTQVDRVVEKEFLKVVRESTLKEESCDDSVASSKGLSIRTVTVPAGKLGIVVDASEEGPLVQEVYPTSALKGRIHPGDRILSINGIVTKGMPRTALAALMATGTESVRTFTIISPEL